MLTWSHQIFWLTIPRSDPQRFLMVFMQWHAVSCWYRKKHIEVITSTYSSDLWLWSCSCDMVQNFLDSSFGKFSLGNLSWHWELDGFVWWIFLICLFFNGFFMIFHLGMFFHWNFPQGPMPSIASPSLWHTSLGSTRGTTVRSAWTCSRYLACSK